MLKYILFVSAISLGSGVTWAQDTTEATEDSKKSKKKEKKAKKAKKEKVPRTDRQKAFSSSLVAFRGMGEVWADAAISRVHRSSRFAGSGAFATNLSRVFGIECELGYSRMTNPTYLDGSLADGAGTTSFEMIPVAADLTMRAQGERSEVFFGLGAAMVGFNDTSPLNAVSGTKVGLDMRFGTRIKTGFLQESLYPVDRGLKSMDIELIFGRRQHRGFGMGQGLDLSAWRVGIGLAARL